MTDAKEKIKVETFRVKANSFAFEHNGEEVVLPQVRGYTPSYNDALIVYKEENPKTKSDDTIYSFEDKKGELKALYALHQDGSVDIKINGKDASYVSKEDMQEIKEEKAGFFFPMADGQKAFMDGDKAAIGAGVVAAMGGGPVVGCGVALVGSLANEVNKSKNNNPKIVEMPIIPKSLGGR